MEEKRAGSEGVERDKKWTGRWQDGDSGEGTGDEEGLGRRLRI